MEAVSAVTVSFLSSLGFSVTRATKIRTRTLIVASNKGVGSEILGFWGSNQRVDGGSENF